MKKKYELPAENKEADKISEPALGYDHQTEIDKEILPSLSEEELRECITGDDLRAYMHDYIHDLFNKK